MKLKQPALLKVCELTAEHTVKNFTDLREHFLCLGIKVCYVRKLADFEGEGAEISRPERRYFRAPRKIPQAGKWMRIDFQQDYADGSPAF